MKYTLDISKWRCGGQGEHSLGKSVTQMLNDEGYMCCLGQFAEQAGVSDDHLRGRSNPADVNASLNLETKLSYDELFCDNYNGDHAITGLAQRLVQINDDEYTNPNEKIHQIRETFRRFDIELDVRDDNNILDQYGTDENG